jgi:hypothetical protein
MQLSFKLPSIARSRPSLRACTAVAATGATVFLLQGPAFAAEQPQTRAAATVDVACQGVGAVRFSSDLGDSARPDNAVGSGLWTGCRDGVDRPAYTGDAVVRSAGSEFQSCDVAFSDGSSSTVAVRWANGEESVIETSVAVDVREQGQDLVRLSGRVVSGAYAGDRFFQSGEAGSNDPEACQGRGIDEESSTSSVVLWH